MRARLHNIRASRADGTHIPEPPSQERVERSVYRILDETRLCAWSTVTEDHTAHVNIGYFAYSDALEFYLLSHPDSRHCRNIEANSSMAVAVFESRQRWTDPGRGLQLFGTCARAIGTEATRAELVYDQRFRAFSAWKAAIAPTDPEHGYRFYRFLAERIKVLDEFELGEAVFVEADIVGRGGM